MSQSLNAPAGGEAEASALPLEGGYVAECFWAGVTEDDVRALDERAGDSATELARRGANVRYVGSILMPADEVVLCLFQGSVEAVRDAVRQARIPVERLVEGIQSGVGQW
jgi:hypothetical protein